MEREATGDAPLLSVAIVTLNEADNLPRVLASVAWADEIVVVDSGSTDATRNIARSHGAVVETAPWPGDGPQKARALGTCRGRWVLLLDADEEVTPELAAEIRRTLRGEPGFVGYEIEMRTWHLGTWFGTRGWHRERHLRLARRDRARMTEAVVHGRLEVDGRVGRLRGRLLHYTYRDVSHHMAKMATYTDLKARQMYERGRRSTAAGAVGHGLWRFLSGYLFQGGFLYGWPGLAADLLGAHGTLLSYLKLAELVAERRAVPERRRVVEDRDKT